MMSYIHHYTLADPIVGHLNSVVPEMTDPFIITRYIGLVSVAAVTVYELCIKEIFCGFGHKKHKVFGTYVNKSFERINGRIKLSNITEDYLPRFGDIYIKRFKKKLEKAEKTTIRQKHKSIRGSYGNIIVWRNQFAHEGDFPSTVTYQEAVESYQLGKEVIRILAETMRR